MKLKKVIWKCPKCKTKNKWFWQKCDCYPGVLFMECSACMEKTKMVLRKRKRKSGWKARQT